MLIFRTLLHYLLILGFFHSILFADNTLIRINGNEPETLYPLADTNSLASNIRRDLFEPLMSKDREGNVILGQAKSYTLDKTKTIYTFILRDDAKWSDGSPVTAYDFEYTYRYMADPKNHISRAQYLKRLNILNIHAIINGEKPVKKLGIKVFNEKTIQITLEKPTYYFLAGLSHICMSPLSEKIIKKSKSLLDTTQNFISNGAYQLQNWEREKQIVLKKNPYYYDVKKVQIETVIYLPIDKESKAFNMYMSGEVDYLEEVPKNKYNQLKKEYPDELKTSNLLGSYYLSFNLKKELFNQLNLRKALSYAIDREVLAKKVMGTGEKPLYNFVPKGMQNYITPIPEYQKWTQAQRESKARTLFKEFGFTTKNPLQFELLYNANEQNRRVLLSVISMWKKVFHEGINVKLKALNWNAYQKEKINYSIVRSGWIADINDASNMLEIFTQNHSYNNSFYKNKLFEKKFAKAKITKDLKIREALYQKLDLIITEDMPIIPLFQFTTARLVKPYVKGYKNTPLDTIFSKYLSIEKSHD